MIKIISDILKNLCIADGVSGFEYNISNLILDYFQKFTDEAYIDKLGNVIGIKKSFLKGGFEKNMELMKQGMKRVYDSYKVVKQHV